MVMMLVGGVVLILDGILILLFLQQEIYGARIPPLRPNP
jgi:hypothetical protein